MVTYEIVNGNTDDAFSITNYTGEIRVKNPLDYERTTSYSLDVRASDGIYDDFAKVIITILNINDNPPIFVANYSKTIAEETTYTGCIVKARIKFQSLFLIGLFLLVLRLMSSYVAILTYQRLFVKY